MENIIEEFDKLKRSRTAHKGKITSLFKRLDQLSKLETVREDKLSELIKDLDHQMSKCLGFNEQMEDLLRENKLLYNENEEPTSHLVDIEELRSQLLSQELQAETLYASMKEKTFNSEVPPSSGGGGAELVEALVGVQSKLGELCKKTHTGRAPLKLTGLEPPSWDGKKANFYTWKEMFTHTMAQACMMDDQVQITWLLRKGTIPVEYQA